MTIKQHGMLAVASVLTMALTGCGGTGRFDEAGHFETESGAYANTTITVLSDDYFIAQAEAGDGESTDGAAETGTSETPGESGGSEPGSFHGRVVLNVGPGGLEPKVAIAKGTSSKDPAVCAADADILDDSLLIGSEGGVANVFIFVDKAPKGAAIAAVPEEKKIFDQKGCVFKPHALVVRVAQPLFVLNDDGVSHNTHTYPKRNSVFNNTVALNDRDGLDMTYKKAEKEPVRVVCDIHPWMVAYHLPVDHQFAAVTDANGAFRIDGLPPGKHKFKIWHEAGGLLKRSHEVTIVSGDGQPQEISFALGDFARFQGAKPKVVRLAAK